MTLNNLGYVINYNFESSKNFFYFKYYLSKALNNS